MECVFTETDANTVWQSKLPLDLLSQSTYIEKYTDGQTVHVTKLSSKYFLRNRLNLDWDIEKQSEMLGDTTKR